MKAALKLVDKIFDQIDSLIMMYPANNPLRKKVLKRISNIQGIICKAEEANAEVIEWLKQANMEDK